MFSYRVGYLVIKACQEVSRDFRTPFPPPPPSPQLKLSAAGLCDADWLNTKST